MTKAKKQYNYCLNFIKGIACICVVLMHCEFPGRLGTIVQTTSRFCVPFFFMVSGFFATNLVATRNGESWLFNRKVKHIAKITIWASLFYIVFAVIQYMIWHDVSLNVSKSQALIWILFNDPVVVAGQMWFLFALLYDYLLITVLDRFKLQKFEFVMGIVMLVMFYFMGQGVHLIGQGIPVPDIVVNDFGGNIPHMQNGRIPVPNFLYRNFLFEGFAFFMLGRLIYLKKDRLKVNNAILLSIIVVSTLLCIVERDLMGRDFGVNLCSLPQVVALFLYGINNPKKHESVIQKIGKDCSMLVYILHPFVWHSMERIYDWMGITNDMTALYMLPVIVVLLSLILSLFCNWFTNTFKEQRYERTKYATHR